MLQNGSSLVDHSIVTFHSPYPSACTDSSSGGLCVVNGTTTTTHSSTNKTSVNGNTHTTNNGLSSTLCGNTLSSLISALAASGGLPPNIKDSRWLTLEVCRQFQRNQCSRDEKECKFAHPPTHVDVQNGRVICCYDSIKGKCQRREPPCKYLHPPQHLREQLMQNGRNNMILRNMQLQFFQQQLLAQQTGVVSFQTAAVATVGACSSQTSGVSSSSLSGNTGPTSLLYPGAGTLGLSSRTLSNNYPLLNFGYGPFLNALHGSCPDFLSSEQHPNDCSKRSLLIDAKTCLPNYYPRSNGTNDSQSSKLECADSSSMVVNGAAIEAEMNGVQSTQSFNICSTMEAATAAATLYALQCSQNAALLNLHAPPPLPHPPGPPAHHPLTARSLVACTVSGGPTMAPTPFHALTTHAGFYQPTYHIEIPPYPYQ